MKTILLHLTLILLLTSCSHSPRFQSSRVNNESHFSLNGSNTNLKLMNTEQNYTTSVAIGDFFFEVDTTFYPESRNNVFYLKNIVPNYSKTFLQNERFPKIQLSGFVAPLLFVNYADITAKAQVLEIGKQKLFQNVSTSLFGTFSGWFALNDAKEYGYNFGTSIGTFHRFDDHEFELATNLQYNSYNMNTVYNEEVSYYKAYLVGLGSSYTFWKKGKGDFFSITLGLLYNIPRETYYHQFGNSIIEIDPTDLNNNLTQNHQEQLTKDGIPYTVSITFKNCF